MFWVCFTMLCSWQHKAQWCGALNGLGYVLTEEWSCAGIVISEALSSPCYIHLLRWRTRTLHLPGLRAQPWWVHLALISTQKKWTVRETLCCTTPIPQMSNYIPFEFAVEHDRNTWLKVEQAITQGCVVLIRWVAWTSYWWSNHLGHSLVFKCPPALVLYDSWFKCHLR